MYCIGFFIYSIFLSFFNLAADDLITIKNNILNVYHQHEAEKLVGTKSTNIDITKDGFLRYKRILNNNKTEYFSVKLNKINTLTYLGTERGGWVLLKCETSSVIYQTYKDPAGDVDSMMNELPIPFKSVTPEDLTILEDNFRKLKTSTENHVQSVDIRR